MNNYKDLLMQLNQIIDKVNEYEIQTKDLQNLLGEKVVESNELISNQIQKVDALKDEISGYFNKYNASFNKITDVFANKLSEISRQNIENVSDKVKNEIDKKLGEIEKTYFEEYELINKTREELMVQLKQNYEMTRNETNNLKLIQGEIDEQNLYLLKINTESKEYIESYKKEIKSLKTEIDLMKENFELKYVYDKNRIIFTSVFSMGLLVMISIAVVISVFMFLYYTKLIIFPSRSIALFYGISMCLLAIGLLGILITIIVRPPTFLKTRLKIDKGEK